MTLYRHFKCLVCMECTWSLSSGWHHEIFYRKSCSEYSYASSAKWYARKLTRWNVTYGIYVSYIHVYMHAGNTLMITALNNTVDNIYVKGVTLNNKPIDMKYPFIEHSGNVFNNHVSRAIHSVIPLLLFLQIL